MPIMKEARERQVKRLGGQCLREGSGQGPELKTENNLHGNENDAGKIRI